MPDERPAGAGEPPKPKGRVLRLLSAITAVGAIAGLFVGGSQPSHSAFGITLVILSVRRTSHQHHPLRNCPLDAIATTQTDPCSCVLAPSLESVVKKLASISGLKIRLRYLGDRRPTFGSCSSFVCISGFKSPAAAAWGVLPIPRFRSMCCCSPP